MSEDSFSPGQLVVCINASPVPQSRRWPALVLGRIYTVGSVYPHPRCVHVSLEEHADGGWAWFASRFRPSRPTSIEQFRPLLSSGPVAPVAPVLEDA